MKLGGYRNVVVLTGAGMSRSAGLATYRGPGGLWTDPKLEQLSRASALADHRVEVTDMFWSFRAEIAKVEPTAAHRALAAFEAGFTGNFVIVTQNVDGLHQRAGSKHVVEYHGSLARWRCEACGFETSPPAGVAPEHCGARMRPSLVLFDEMIPPDAEHTTKRALRDCDLFVAIGTSGTVSPASSFVRSAAYAGARRLLLNLEIFDDARELYSECHAGTADELVPNWFAI